MESAFLALAVLACPLGMGAMLWFMAKGMKGNDSGSAASPELAEMKAEQERLAVEVDRLEREAEPRGALAGRR